MVSGAGWLLMLDRWSRAASNRAVYRSYRGFRPEVAGTDVSAAIRMERVNDHVSAVSAIPEVREWVNGQLREAVRQHPRGAVMDGRDIGTVVFPEAALKVFLIADPEERADPVEDPVLLAEDELAGGGVPATDLETEVEPGRHQGADAGEDVERGVAVPHHLRDEVDATNTDDGPDVPGAAELRWLDIRAARWAGREAVRGGGTVSLTPPGKGQWAALIQRAPAPRNNTRQENRIDGSM